MKNKKQKGEALLAVTIGLCAIIGLLVLSKNDIKNEYMPVSISGDKEITEIVQINLPTFNSKKEIIELVKKNSEESNILKDYFVTDDAFISMEQFNSANAPTANRSESVATGTSQTTSSENISKEHSNTNIQVQGVDEGDIVKTNGNFIYYITNQKLYIFDTKTTKTQLVKTIELDDKFNSYTRELYIDDNYITVICNEHANRLEILKNETENVNNAIEENKLKIDYDYKYSTTFTSVYVYDINTYELVKNIKTEGDYVSSRKIENNIYMFTNRYLYAYSINEDNILPIYTETNINGAICKEIEASNIKYFPNINNKSCSYMLITSVNLTDIESEAKVDTYLGAGTEIYCSKDNLFVTRVEYPNAYRSFIGNISIAIDSMTVSNDETPKVVTKIHKFKLLDGAVQYVATGEVPGALLNQYSMDERNGNFRITTTSENGNSLYILDQKLEIIGKLENLAKGEKIYSTRFMGDKCYMVTYKTVDPLYVIDLSTPTNPNVLGELKLPGYSTYLHPLGENYLIGFGEDSIEKSYIDWQGKTQVTAYNVGLKLAIFDVSNLKEPKELYSVRVGGRGSTSALLDNPRALYYDVEEGIFAFPATLCEETRFYEDGTPMYGDVIFSGALVYNLSAEEGIELRGKIEHENSKKYYQGIERIISIGDNFYTISPTMIKVTDIETMKNLDEGTCKFGDKKI